MVWYLTIAFIAGGAAFTVWGVRLMSLRRGVMLTQNNFFVRRVLKAKALDLYEEYLRDLVSTVLSRARSALLVVLKWVYVRLRNSTGSLEHRFIALMNMVRGKGVENTAALPSKFLGELKEHKDGLELPTGR